ncbi:MAG TPA: hypothetical protein VFQ61_04810 [Polyangiaceae bacterium]|nr:hypothetical protein [Polyangiaceae bacterium]
MTNRRLRVAAAIVGLCAGTLQVLAWWLSTQVESLYAEERLWLIGEYSEPWHSLARVVAIGVSTGVFLLPFRLDRRDILVKALALVLGLAISFELATAVHFNIISGELSVDTLIWSRSRLRLDAGETGWCVKADLSHPWVWRIDGQAVYPRLLPLPQNTGPILDRLRYPSCPVMK